VTSVPSRLEQLATEVADCRACPRLVAWREEVALVKRKSFADQQYWGRGVPGFGDPHARLLVLGLAPAAHGANRTGRMFTGDRSGDFLFASLHRTGFANQPESVGLGDGLVLDGAWITSPVKCAPPANKPTTEERDRCRPFLDRELDALDIHVVVALGGFGWRQACEVLELPRPWPAFGHGAEHVLLDGRVLLGSYHVSQQNTFTGRLTEPMLDQVFSRARTLLASENA
jgi:uracil-DNA glycosylase family 4